MRNPHISLRSLNVLGNETIDLYDMEITAEYSD